MPGSTFSAAESLLVRYVQDLFPLEQTLVNVHKNLSIKYPDTNDYMEFDVWVPNLNLSFEFQDPHHYVESAFVNQRNHASVQLRDYIKQNMALQHSLTLVVIPCWWDCSIESLVASILFQRPDLQIPESNVFPVSLNPPYGYFSISEIPDIGDMMLVSFPNDEFYSNFQQNTWWMGEKYDGIRFCGHTGTLYSRTGRKFFLNEKIANFLPGISLDGEFWFGRGQSSCSDAFVKGSLDNLAQLRTILFDVPTSEQFPFEDRYDFLTRNLCAAHPFCVLAARITCQSKARLQEALDMVISDSGEGVVLRKAGSLYVPGRSGSLLKIKGPQFDMEGIVVACDHDGVQLHLPNGHSLIVPASNVEVNEIQVGNLVTINFLNFERKGIPANPTICKIRTDLTWEDVLGQYLNGSTEPDGIVQDLPSFEKAPNSKWQVLANRRKFFEDYAKMRGFDPQNVEMWYGHSLGSIMAVSGARQIILYHGNSITKALCDLFPDLEFDLSEFSRTQYSNPKARTRFLENLAREHGLDPHNPEDWYKKSRKEIMSAKGSAAVMLHHNNSVATALMDLFPNIGLEDGTLKRSIASKSLADPATRRDTIESIAMQQGLDPRNPENWYNNGKEVLVAKGARSVLNYHNSSLPLTLSELFPDIGIDRLRFARVKASEWTHKENRRRFFEQYAKQNAFEPLVPSNWYSQPWQKILANRKAKRVVSYHRNSVSTALVDLFPELQWPTQTQVRAFMGETKRHFQDG